MNATTLTRNIGHAFGENRLTLVAVAILLVLLLCAAFGSVLAPYNPLMTDGTAKLAAPCMAQARAMHVAQVRDAARIHVTKTPDRAPTVP